MRPRPPLPTKTNEELERARENQPRGLAVGVVFDWATAMLFGALLVVAIVQRGLDSRQAAAAGFLALVVGLPLVGLGEALRRGRRGARLVQVTVSGLIAAINVVGLIRDLGDLFHGEIPHTTNLPSLLAGIYVIWGLTRPQTIAWFARTKPARVRERHGGRWLQTAIGLSVVIGIIAVFISVL
jgi:hypothetical protein